MFILKKDNDMHNLVFFLTVSNVGINDRELALAKNSMIRSLSVSKKVIPTKQNDIWLHNQRQQDRGLKRSWKRTMRKLYSDLSLLDSSKLTSKNSCKCMEQFVLTWFPCPVCTVLYLVGPYLFACWDKTERHQRKISTTIWFRFFKTRNHRLVRNAS